MLKRRYYLESYEAEIPNRIRASCMYEGYALDNDCDVHMEEYHSLESAKEALKSCSNEYHYNGHGYGWAEEYAVTIWSVDENGEDVMQIDFIPCKSTNLPEFLQKWGDDD